jgi:hypothetical protein
MPNSPGVIGTPDIHDVAEGKNLQGLVASGSVSIDDVGLSQSSSKTTTISAAGNLATPARGGNKPSTMPASLPKSPRRLPSAIGSVPYEFMIGCALPANSASRNALLD